MHHQSKSSEFEIAKMKAIRKELGSSSGSDSENDGWTRHASKNCYKRHGAVDITGSLGRMSVDACKQRCKDQSGCDCIQMWHGKCYLRKQCVIRKCQNSGRHGQAYIYAKPAGDEGAKENSLIVFAFGVSYARKPEPDLGNGNAIDGNNVLRSMNRATGEGIPLAHEAQHEELAEAVHHGRRGGATGLSTSVEISFSSSNRAGNSEAQFMVD